MRLEQCGHYCGRIKSKAKCIEKRHSPEAGKQVVVRHATPVVTFCRQGQAFLVRVSIVIHGLCRVDIDPTAQIHIQEARFDVLGQPLFLCHGVNTEIATLAQR